MTYNEIVADYLSKGLMKRQKTVLRGVAKLIQRARIDLKTAKANLAIDEGIAYSVAYLAMLRSGRALMLLKGFRPADGYQHKTVVEFAAHYLGADFKAIIAHFDRMRRKRNIFMYDIEVSISIAEAKNALDTAIEFVELIEKRIKDEQPQIQLEF